MDICQYSGSKGSYMYYFYAQRRTSRAIKRKIKSPNKSLGTNGKGTNVMVSSVYIYTFFFLTPDNFCNTRENNQGGNTRNGVAVVSESPPL